MPDQEKQALELKSIQKSFGIHRVLENLSLTIYPGDFVILLGANGSGKSTLVRLCVGLSKPDRGEILFPRSGDQRVKQTEIGHVGHSLFLYKSLSVKENLELYNDLAGGTVDVDAYLKAWSLYAERDKKVSELSKGLQCRVSLSRAFIHQPRYLFLDEPTSSLDEAATDLLLKKAKASVEQQDGLGFVLVATHDVRRLAEFANRILVLNNGVIAKDLLEVRKEHPDTSLEELKKGVIQFYLEANR